MLSLKTIVLHHENRFLMSTKFNLDLLVFIQFFTQYKARRYIDLMNRVYTGAYIEKA